MRNEEIEKRKKYEEYLIGKKIIFHVLELKDEINYSFLTCGICKSYCFNSLKECLICLRKSCLDFDCMECICCKENINKEKSMKFNIYYRNMFFSYDDN